MPLQNSKLVLRFKAAFDCHRELLSQVLISDAFSWFTKWTKCGNVTALRYTRWPDILFGRRIMSPYEVAEMKIYTIE